MEALQGSRAKGRMLLTIKMKPLRGDAEAVGLRGVLLASHRYGWAPFPDACGIT